MAIPASNFPSFTRGRYGDLKHSHLNGAFRSLERHNAALARIASVIGLDRGDRLPLGPYLSKITARSGTTNATYDAATIFWPTFSVTGATPVNRAFDTADVTYNAAAVDAHCEMYVLENQTTKYLVVWETITVASCATTGDFGGVIPPWLFLR